MAAPAGVVELALAPKHSTDEKRNSVSESQVRTDSLSTDELDANVVQFAVNDPENPLNWSLLRKWPMVIAVAMMMMLNIFATTTIIPAAPQVLEEFKVTDNLYQTLLVSIWELGEGVGPFFVGPLAERFGRLPVYHIGNLLGLLCGVASALSVNISMLVAFRFLSGAVLPTLTLGPTIIGDMFPPEQRGTAMAIGVGMSLIGTFIAPICGSFIADALGWRWTLWLNVIAIGAIAVFGALILRETYAVKILEKRAARLRKETGDPTIRTKYHTAHGSMLESATRPAQVLFRSPTVALISIYTALTYALAYTVLTTLTEIMESVYGWGKGIVGLAFLSSSIGNALGMLVYALISDRFVNHKAKQRPDGKTKPEDRLVLMLVGAFMMPLGLLLYGWTLQYHVQWIVPMIGAALTGFSIMLAMLPTENYLVDAYEVHSASAISAGVILRAFSGALFPLCAPALYHNLGLGWGNSVLALCGAVFIPLLVLLVRYGSRPSVRGVA